MAITWPRIAALYPLFEEFARRRLGLSYTLAGEVVRSFFEDVREEFGEKVTPLNGVVIPTYEELEAILASVTYTPPDTATYTTTGGNVEALGATGFKAFDPLAKMIFEEMLKTVGTRKPVRPTIFFHPEDKEVVADLIERQFTGLTEEAAKKLAAFLGEHIGDIPLLSSEFVERGTILLATVPVTISEIRRTFEPYNGHNSSNGGDNGHKSGEDGQNAAGIDDNGHKSEPLAISPELAEDGGATIDTTAREEEE